MPLTNRPAFRDAVTGASLIAFILLVAFAYITRERMIYAWDEANYTGLTAAAYEAFFPAKPDPPSHTFRPVYGVRQTYDSLHQEYNWLFALPLVAFERCFGTSRTAYTLGLTLIYFVPYCLVWGLVAARIFVAPSRAAFWGIVAVILALPLTYLPVFRSFPDIGAAALLGIVVLMYLRDIEMKDWRRIVAIGFILCLLPLFRRHFMYGLTAFFATALLQHFLLLLGHLRRNPKEAGAYFLKMAPRFIGLGLIIVGLWWVLAHPCVEVLRNNNYFNLYSSYMIEPLDVLVGFVSAYGYIMVIAALAGYFFGWRCGVFRSPGGAFIALLFLITTLQWMLVVRQQGSHYLNHFNIFIAFGLAALAASAWNQRRGLPRTLVFFGVAAILLYRAGVCFGLISAFDSPDPDGIVMAKLPPKVRRDFDTVNRLITALREKGGKGANVFVAACSWTLSCDIIKNGEEDTFGKANALLVVPGQPAIDSRDWLPLDSLLKSQVAVAVWPGQYSVSPAEQKIITLTAEAFKDNLPIARDFERLPGDYPLENGATATLYRRVRASSRATALQELGRETEPFPTLPGRQKPWISIDGDTRGELDEDKKPTFRLTLHEAGYRPLYLTAEEMRHRSLVYVGAEPPKGRLTADVALGGRWNGKKIVVRCFWADPATGAELSPVTSAPLTDRVPLALPIPPSPAAPGKPRLLLEFLVPPENDNPKTPTDGALILGSLGIVP